MYFICSHLRAGVRAGADPDSEIMEVKPPNGRKERDETPSGASREPAGNVGNRCHV